MQNQGQNKIKVEQSGTNLLWGFLSLLKRFWFIMLATVILFAAAGVVYVQYKKPVYTATERAMVIARISEGNPDNFAATQLYLPTIKDMARQGVVIDRANFYYQKYLESEFYATGNISGFIQKISSIEYTSAGEQKYFSSGSVSISYMDDGSSNWINISYSSADKGSVTAKAKILTAALDQELKLKTADNDEKYTFLAVSVVPWGSMGVSSNVGYKKTIMICLLLGVVSGVALAYLLSLFDRTLKTEEALEAITGVNNFGLIKAEREGV